MGTVVRYNHNSYTLNENESVLDCLLREQETVPHSCKSGACQSCLMQISDGDVPEKSQEGLKATFKKRKLFLACQCYPDNNINVNLPDESGISIKATIVEKTSLSDNVLNVRLQPEEPFECEPGQYLTMITSNNVARSYSVANNPVQDGHIELHVRLIPDGLMSNWLQESTGTNNEILLRGPAGDCFYLTEEDKDFPIILAGTGTGLAPLYGIITEALAQGHEGKINLYHGALKEEDLYFIEELSTLENTHTNFTYTACVLRGEEGKFYQVGNIENIVIANIPDEKTTVRLFLCGAPELVNSLKNKAFIRGISSKHIYADAFLPSK